MPSKLQFKLVVVGAEAGHGLADGPESAATAEYSGGAIRIRAGGTK